MTYRIHLPYPGVLPVVMHFMDHELKRKGGERMVVSKRVDLGESQHAIPTVYQSFISPMVNVLNSV